MARLGRSIPRRLTGFTAAAAAAAADVTLSGAGTLTADATAVRDAAAAVLGTSRLTAAPPVPPPTVPVAGALAGNAASVDVPGGSALLAGDRRYIILTLSSGPTPTTPAGWSNTLDAQVGTTTTRRLYLFERDAAGADGPTTITFSGASNYAATHFATRGGLATVVGPSVTTAETGTVMTAPAVITTDANSLLVCHFSSLNASSSVADTVPTGMVSQASVVPGGSGHAARLCTEIRGTAGDTGTRASTGQTSARWAALSMAVSPSGLADPIWVGDAETGDFSQLADPTGGVDQLPPQTRAVVTDPRRAGSYAYELAVNGVSGTPVSTRSEARAKALAFREGDDLWVAGSILVPSGFPISPGGFQVVAQLKADVAGTPPVTVNIENGRIELQGGFGRPAGSLPMPAKNLAPADTDVWHDLLLHVVFSSDPTVGQVTVWHNGTQVLAPYKPPGGTLYATYDSYLKFGLYRDPALPTTATTRVYHDEWRVGTTRGAVELTTTTVLASTALAGSASVTVAATQDVAASAAASAAASVTVAATQDVAGAAAATGSGSLAADAGLTRPAAAALAADGVVVADGGRDQSVAATLGAAGVVSATVGAVAEATLAGSATVSADAWQTHSATVAVAATGAVGAAMSADQLVSATVSGSGGVGGVALSDIPVAAALTGAGAVAVSGTPARAARAALAAVGAATATAVCVRPAVAALSGAAALSAAAAGAAAGSVNIALWAVDRDGGALTALPGWAKLSLTQVMDGAGAVSVDYPAGAPGFALLRAGVTDSRDLEVEIWREGRASSALRAVLHTAAGDDVDESAVWTFTGSLLEVLLAEVQVFPQAGDEKKELRFAAATAGTMVATLLTQAQARGGLLGMTRDFTSTSDSSGRPWPEVATVRFSPQVTYLAVLQRLVELGLCDFEVTPTRVLRLYRPGGMGTDRTVGTQPTVIRRGRNVTESPRTRSVRSAVTTVLVAGADGVYAVASDPTALARRGRRVEGAADSNNLTDQVAVQAWAARALPGLVTGEMELLLGLSFGAGHPRPGTHFAVGDWVWADATGVLERLRVVQYTLEVDGGGPKGSVTLNDLRTEWRIRTQRRLDAIASGDAVIGTSQPPPTVDGLAPAAPSGLTVSSLAYQDGANEPTSAVVTVSFVPPTTNTDGTTLDDLGGFRARLRYRGLVQTGGPGATPGAAIPGGGAGQWTFSDTVGAGASQITMTDVHPNADIEVQVQAFDSSDPPNDGPWSAGAVHTTESDATPPPQPSAPTARDFLRQLVVEWDGLSSAGIAMVDAARDFDHVQVHVSPASNFTPTPTTLFERLYAKGGVVHDPDAYVGARYFRLVAADRTGNLSAPSGQASATPARAVADDIGDQVITAAKVADGQPLGPKISAEQISTGHLTVATFSDNLVPNGGFEDIALGGGTLPASWAVGTSTAGTFTRATTNVSSGAGSAKLSLAAASALLNIVSDTIPVKPGDNLYVQLTAKASRAVNGLSVRVGVGPTDPATGSVVVLAANQAVGTAFGGMEANYTVPATVGGVAPRYLRLDILAGAVVGDAAAVDIWVDEVRVRKTVGTLEVQDAAISRAKIGLLAVGDGQFESASVGKLTAGTLTATVTLSGIIRTASTGQRMQIDGSGWRAYDAAGAVFAQLDIAAESMLVTGEVRTGVTGERIRILADGTQRMYGATGSDYAEIANVGGIVRMRSRADASGRRSYVDFDPTGFFAYYGVAGGAIRSTFQTGLTYGILTAPALGCRVDKRFAPTDATENRFFLVASTTGTPGGDVLSSVVHYRSVTGNQNNAGLNAPGKNCGIMWGNNEMWATGGDGLAFGPIAASAFNVNSSLAAKEHVTPARFGSGRSFRDVVQGARAMEYEYIGEGDRPARPDAQLLHDDGTRREARWEIPPTPRSKRYGPVAEHLLGVDPKLVQTRSGSGELVLNVANIAGLAWGAAGEAHDRLDDLAAVTRQLRHEVDRLRDRLDGTVVDGEVVHEEEA